MEPLSVWGWRDAIRAVLSDKATVVSEYSDIMVRSCSFTVQLPCVIALKTYNKASVVCNAPSLNREHLLIRDGYQCQYCGIAHHTGASSAGRLTMDHVMPRSLGGKSTWTNLVSCCVACNSKKVRIFL